VPPQKLHYQPPMNTNIPAGLGQPFSYPMQQPGGGAAQCFPMSAQQDTLYQQLKSLPGNFLSMCCQYPYVIANA